jgi:hypothetical protein
MRGLVPRIPTMKARSRLFNRDGRDKPGHDAVGLTPEQRVPERGAAVIPWMDTEVKAACQYYEPAYIIVT